MKTLIDWSAYRDSGMGDPYADIPKHGGDFAKAVSVCINSRQCEAEGKQVMCPSFQMTGDENLSTGGRVVVGLEASCVLGLRDDAQALGLGADVAEVGKHVLLFEEFLAKEIKAKRLNLELRALEAETLVHGHCHQKAVGAMKAMRRVLKEVPDHDFSMIESGCCGMAGTFGLEAEHAEMSTALAEQSLMPALRAKPNATVVANGFSCRQQMRGLGDARPVHLAVLLKDALVRENP